MDDWEKFNGALSPDKKRFIEAQTLLMQITGTQQEFEDKFHDFYCSKQQIIASDVHKNFRDKCIEIYELEIAYFLSGSARIIMASSFKKKK